MLLVDVTWKSENASLSETHIDEEECKQFFAKEHTREWLPVQHTPLASAFLQWSSEIGKLAEAFRPANFLRVNILETRLSGM